ENIHAQLQRGLPPARAVLEGATKTALPRLLAMFCVLAVFVSSFFMQGAARSLFVPLSLAVGFAMITSYLLSSTLVPVLSVWLLRGHEQAAAHARRQGRLARGFRGLLGVTTRLRWLLVPAYLGLAGLAVWLGGRQLGTEIF